MENMFNEIYNEAKFPDFEQINDEFNVATPYQKLDESIISQLNIPPVFAEIKYPQKKASSGNLTQLQKKN